MISAHSPFHWWGHIESLACEIIGFSGGEVPSEWRERWQQMQEDATSTIDFSKSGSESAVHHPCEFLSITNLSLPLVLATPRPSLLDRYTAVAPEPELAPLIPIMQALIKLRPTDRISAREALALSPPRRPRIAVNWLCTPSVDGLRHQGLLRGGRSTPRLFTPDHR